MSKTAMYNVLSDELKSLNARLSILEKIETPCMADLDQVHLIQKRAFEVRAALRNVKYQLGLRVA